MADQTVFDGNNTILYYPGATIGYSIFVRTRELLHGWDVIATESHARADRAFYPHQRSVGKFSIKLELNGYNEYKSFMNYMLGYVNLVASADAPVLYPMQVSVWPYNFNRNAIPIKGMADGDHVGSQVFTPTLVFQTLSDTGDPTVLTASSPQVSQVTQPTQGGASGTDVRNFFYPFSQAMRDPNLKPETLYDFGNPDVPSTPAQTGGSGSSGSGSLPPGVGGTGPSLPPPGSSGIPGSPF